MARTWARWWGVAVMALQVWAGSPLPATDFFVANEGQWEGAFAFRYEGNGATYFLTPTGMTIDLRKYHPLSSPRERGERTVSPDDLLLPRVRGRLGWGEDRGRGRLGRGEEREPVTVHGHVLRLTYLNANPSPVLIGEDKLASYSNYFMGRDTCKWRSRVGHFRSVLVKEVWPGIDVEYRVATEGTEAVYHVHPFADPSRIQLRYEGQNGPITVDANRCLHLRTSLGDVFEAAPFAFQDIHHQQREIPCRFALVDERTYRLRLGEYDASKEVVIDPLVYCSYWGGASISNLYGGIAEDREHHKLVSGLTLGEAYFPLTPGAYCDSSEGWTGYLSKFNAGGDTLLFSTFLGGGHQVPCHLAADVRGSVYVTGDIENECGALPLTPDAFDTICAGSTEGYLSRYSADGTVLEFSSYLGGSAMDLPDQLAVDSSGYVYVAGATASTDFPVTPNALFPQPTSTSNAFLAVFDPLNSRLYYSTYFPGRNVSPSELTVSGLQRVWLCGDVAGGGLPITADAIQPDTNSYDDGFFSCLDLQANRLVYSSYFGGSSSTDEQVERVLPLGGDTVLLGGSTSSFDFPVTPDGFDTIRVDSIGYQCKAFLSILALPGTLVHSTLLGGTGGARGIGFIEDELGAFVAVGYPMGRGFPLSPNAEDTSYHPAFVSRLSHDLRRLEYSTLVGGSNGYYDLYGPLLERPRSVWLAGTSYRASDLPTTPNALVPHTPTPDWTFPYGFILCYAMPGDSADASQRSLPVPQDFTLSAFPNPFNPSTTLSFTLPSSSVVKVEMFDVLGRVVWRKEFGRLAAGKDVGVRKVMLLK